LKLCPERQVIDKNGGDVVNAAPNDNRDFFEWLDWHAGFKRTVFIAQASPDFG
jgi:hypothetical protein